MSPPASASAATHRRYALARQVARRLPPTLGDILAVTGSVALGLADDASDIDLHGWVDLLPDADDLAAALTAAGAGERLLLPEPRGPDSIGAVFRVGKVWIDAEWMTLAELDRRLAALTAGTAPSGYLVLAWVVQHALPLRGAELLHPRQQALASYPESWRERSIEATAQFFQHPHAFSALWTYARRPQPFVLADRLFPVTVATLRLLFALNRRWQPDLKWLGAVSRDLPLRPERLVARVEETVTTPAFDRRVQAALTLAFDVLALAPATPQIERARTVIAGALREGGDNADERRSQPEGHSAKRIS
jgi:hypothetical protein